MNSYASQRKLDRAKVISNMLRSADGHQAKWQALGKGMIEGLNQGQSPRLLAVGPAMIGGLKSSYGIKNGFSGKPGKIFEVTCRRDGTLDEEGIGSVYYGVAHLKINTMEIFGVDRASGERTFEQLKAANIEGFGKVDVRIGTKNGTGSFDYGKAHAGVLTCSDSRVLPYQVFEGSNIVVVSNAGNVLSPVAVETFTGLVEAGVPMLAVLGHSKCGAVGAAMGEETEPMLTEIMRKIRSNINIGNGEDRLGKEALNAAVAGAILCGQGGIYEVPGGARLQMLKQEREVRLMAMFMDLSNGGVSCI